MTQVAGAGTVWNLPNYSGELFTADTEQTPFLSMIGGLTQGGLTTDNFEFPTAQLYDYPAPTQPAITETASMTAPASSVTARTQETNVVQTHHEAVTLSYDKLANGGRMSGVNTAGQEANPQNEMDWQIQRKLIKIARDVEFSFIQGTYQKATSSAVANKTRGMLDLITQNVVAAGGALTKGMIDDLVRQMADNGAYFNNMVAFMPAAVKQKFTALFGAVGGFSLPASRNVGGVNITEIETDFFKMGLVWSRTMPAGTVLIADVAHCAPVFQTVPEKGNFFLEDLAKTGAAENKQLFGKIGLAHGPQFLHGKITGIV